MTDIRSFSPKTPAGIFSLAACSMRALHTSPDADWAADPYALLMTEISEAHGSGARGCLKGEPAQTTKAPGGPDDPIVCSSVKTNKGSAAWTRADWVRDASGIRSHSLAPFSNRNPPEAAVKKSDSWWHH